MGSRKESQCWEAGSREKARRWASEVGRQVKFSLPPMRREVSGYRSERDAKTRSRYLAVSTSPHHDRRLSRRKRRKTAIAALTFILRLRHVKQPVFVRRLISFLWRPPDMILWSACGGSW